MNYHPIDYRYISELIIYTDRLIVGQFIHKNNIILVKKGKYVFGNKNHKKKCLCLKGKVQNVYSVVCS